MSFLGLEFMYLHNHSEIESLALYFPTAHHWDRNVPKFSLVKKELDFYSTRSQNHDIFKMTEVKIYFFAGEESFCGAIFLLSRKTAAVNYVVTLFFIFRFMDMSNISVKCYHDPLPVWKSVHSLPGCLLLKSPQYLSGHHL